MRALAGSLVCFCSMELMAFQLDRLAPTTFLYATDNRDLSSTVSSTPISAIARVACGQEAEEMHSATAAYRTDARRRLGEGNWTFGEGGRGVAGVQVGGGKGQEGSVGVAKGVTTVGNRHHLHHFVVALSLLRKLCHHHICLPAPRTRLSSGWEPDLTIPSRMGGGWGVHQRPENESGGRGPPSDPDIPGAAHANVCCAHAGP